MEFADVACGDICRIEPAARYNAVNALLRGGAADSSSGNPAAERRLTVDVVNESGRELPAFCPVPLTLQSHNNHDSYFRITAGNQNYSAWGVTVGVIPAGCCGRAAVSGLAMAKFAACREEQTYLEHDIYPGEAVTPIAAGLIPAGSGTATVIAPPYYDGVQWQPGIVNLGGSIDDQRGEFFVRCISLDGPVFRVEDGNYPANSYCGRTPFPGCGTIPVVEVSGTGSLCLVMTWQHDDSGNAVYSGTIGFTAYRGLLQTRDQAFVYLLADCYGSGKAVVNRALAGELAMPGWIL